MVSVEDSQPHSHSNSLAPPYCQYNHCTPPPASSKTGRRLVRSMRTIRSSLFHPGFPENSPNVSENLTDSVIDIRLGELANKSSSSKISPSFDAGEFLDISRAFSDISACSSDISGELRRLANLPDAGSEQYLSSEIELEAFSSEIIEIISPEDLQPTVKLCIDGLQSSSVAVKRSAAAKLRLLAKNRADNRALIGESGAVPALIPLLRCSDPMTQEHAVTALLNLSLHESNKSSMTNAITFKSLIYVLKTGTEISKQNSACALLNLASIDENKLSIGACGAIPPLVMLLMSGSNRSKKDALTTLYKLCSMKLNKERAVNAGAVRPLVELVAEQGSGVAEKAMVVLSSLVGVEIGREAVVEEGGIPALVEVVEDGSEKGKEFAVMSLLLLCEESVENRGLLVREGAIPPLVALSQLGTLKAKHKAETLLGYLREPRPEASSSSPY